MITKTVNGKKYVRKFFEFSCGGYWEELEE